ncbi:MAG: DoxX family protein [Candidatus Melainabacteria bacterium]|nr:DoxX family protein [Candidatus Melainabacteria bacterium]
MNPPLTNLQVTSRTPGLYNIESLIAFTGRRFNYPQPQLLNNHKKTLSIYLIAALFLFAGVNHFTQPALFLKAMPPWLPWHLPLVHISGVFEILGAIGMLVTKTRPYAAYGLVLLLIAVFPANLHMALNPNTFPAIPVALLYGRLPLQLVLIAWVYRTGKAN